MTCNDVVGLVLCKTSEGSRVVLSDSSVEGYFVKHLDQFSVFTAVSLYFARDEPCHFGGKALGKT